MSLRSSPRVARLTVVLCVAGALGFLSLRASAYLQTVPWMPGFVGTWADANGILRNTAAFFAFGLLAFALLGRDWRVSLALAAFATAIEVAQIWIPSRHFDLLDIVAGLAGLALAWAVVRLAAWLYARP